MTFWQTLGCALFDGGCSDQKKTLLQKLVLQLGASINVSCSTVQNLVQNTTCNLIAKECSNLKLVCENDAYQQASCDIQQQADAAAQVMAQNLSLSTMQQITGSPQGTTEVDLTRKMALQLANACSNSIKTRQVLLSNTTCELAKDANIQSITSVGQDSACIITSAASLAQRTMSSKGLSGKTLSIILLTVAGIILLIFCVMIVLLIRSSGEYTPPKVISAQV